MGLHVGELRSIHSEVRTWVSQCRQASTNHSALGAQSIAFNELLARLGRAAGRVDVHELLLTWMMLIEDVAAETANTPGTRALDKYAADWSAQAVAQLVQAFRDRSIRTSTATQLEVLTVLTNHLIASQAASTPIEILGTIYFTEQF